MLPLHGGSVRLIFVCIKAGTQVSQCSLYNYFRNVINQHLDSSDKLNFVFAMRFIECNTAIHLEGGKTEDR